ncbi:transmembrane protein, putative (macronuclear) [Tetrahymena thermophila SB210]|uniref:Transmembrane protein, putative n=1 Tax=Tetrahymena thermophila (strain SB210) TaxID=312017 RepID=Q234W4_TETTS|nr:transmembrane protein, putative [Tetrahymena thermophila SB210]EAR91889.2 transmembrane protein, putative [Tetrahymena thermophila SB210]|eukprot:XP_001012134.2 transmembrane protein, putative [Tetrahymena thermophila SB210]
MVITYFKINVQYVIQLARFVMEALNKIAQLVRSYYICIKTKHVEVIVIHKMDIIQKKTNVQDVILVVQLAMEALIIIVYLVSNLSIFNQIILVEYVIHKMGIIQKKTNVQDVILVVQLAMEALIIIVYLVSNLSIFNQITQGKCLQCNLSCLTCNGDSSQDCLSCQSGKFLDKNQIYNSEAGSCQSCDQSCLKCQGPSNKDCITCTKNYILLPTLGKCALCEEGYFFNQNSCDYCDQTCLTCTGKDKQDCIDCRPGLILSSISKTCEESSQVQNEQNQLKLSQETGCYDKKQQQIVSTCLDQIENSQSNTKILDTLFIVNLSLIAASSIFTPLGSSLGWIFIQNQQLLAYRIAIYVWNYFKILRKTNSINKNQTTTGNVNMVEQMTDSNIEKLFEMLNQSKNKNKFQWKNQN